MSVNAREVVMKERLAVWAILAGGIALTAAVFFASADVTHWVMGLHRTDVVVRPGPTVYVTVPAHHGHARQRALPAPAPAVPATGGDFTAKHTARARPGHRDEHARRHHRGEDARRHHLDERARRHHQHADGWPHHSRRCRQGQDQAQRIFPGTVATLAVTGTAGWLACGDHAQVMGPAY